MANSSFTFGNASNNNKKNNNTGSFQWGSSTNNSSNNNQNNSNNNSFNFSGSSNNNNNSSGNTNNNSSGNTNIPSFNFGNSTPSTTGQRSINPMIDISRLHNQYNPENQQCRFETVLYNKIPPTMNASAFDKPPLIRPQIWDRGIKDNPYPNKLVPVGIRGSNELNQRSNLCLAGHCSAIKRFQEISEKINVFRDEIGIKTKQTITDLKQTQIYLSQRLLAILRVYVVKMTDAQSSNTNNNLSLHNGNHLSAKEMKLKNVLQQMSRESKQLVQLYTRVHKLSYDLNIESRSRDASLDIKDTAMNDTSSNLTNYCNTNAIVSMDLDHPDPRNMKQMFGFLKQQQMFVQLLSETVQSDVKDLNVIQNGIQNAAQNNSPQIKSMLFGQSNNSSVIYG
eukprot:43062_1